MSMFRFRVLAGVLPFVLCFLLLLRSFLSFLRRRPRIVYSMNRIKAKGTHMRFTSVIGSGLELA